jgi:anti-sigma factor ChrR (cupin superfamily)
MTVTRETPVRAFDQVLDPDMLEALLIGAAPVEPPPEQVAALKARVLARVHERASALANTVTIRADAGEWIAIAPGVALKKLHKDASGSSFLLRLDAGAAIAPHDHDSDEECVVLAGEVRMGELSLRAGDYHLARRGSRHPEVVSPTGALLFFPARGGEHYAAAG